MENLLVGVIGHQNSGKTETWKTLFGSTVRTGSNERRLYLTDHEYVNVFLVSGSPEEREAYVGDLITVENPRIVLCSMQYAENVADTIDYFTERNYFLNIQWINPGYKDKNELPYYDNLGIMNYISHCNSIVSIRNGKINPENRVNEIRDYIYGWAKFRNLLIETL